MSHGGAFRALHARAMWGSGTFSFARSASGFAELEAFSLPFRPRTLDA